MKKNQFLTTRQLTLGAMLTALVVVLQLLGSFIRFGPFSISLVLIPIVIGASTCGVKVGAWLGLVFGVVVLANGDAAPFLAVDIFGTIVTVLAKGLLCGLVAALVFKALEKKNRYLAVIVAAVICPVVNTGVFLLGCLLFFMDTIASWGTSMGYESVVRYMLLGLVGGNFLFELATNIVLSPIVVRLLDIRSRQGAKKKM